MAKVLSANLGYPRIGANREWKKAIEGYWAGKIDEETLHRELTALRMSNLQTQRDRGIDIIPVGDFTYYDHVLDTSVMFGVIPQRFKPQSGEVSLANYYEIARGKKEAPASEMTKWFNTNYHYIVPELAGFSPKLAHNRPLAAYREAKQELGIEGRPVILGLFTYLKLSKGWEEDTLRGAADKLLPLYIQVLQELAEEGVKWVQVDEPSLVTALSDDDLALLQSIYGAIATQVPGISIMLQTYFEALERYEEIVALPVKGIGLDFVHDKGANLANLRKSGFPKGKVLGAGVIDGRNIWRADLFKQGELLEDIIRLAGESDVLVQPSSSLLHVPVAAGQEQKLEPALKQALSFAEEKLTELSLLAGWAADPQRQAGADQFAESRRALQDLQALPARNNAKVQAATANLDQLPDNRRSPFEQRSQSQKEKWRLPFLPTTTIGSFPQTPEIRSARQKWRKGEWSKERYDEFIREQIAQWIAIQEEIGLDVLVHGEFERTDMVEFFGEKLAGFAFTSGGWVQSYGSRCVKPPVIYGDVDFVEPMTVAESVYAQSLTQKPVKGMLTGPITILNWSFVRSDLTREEVCYQIALALREEIKALESAGIEMIQVDEPALREGLPLKRKDWEGYLNWAVRAFRLSTSDVEDTTQIHTHMCYSEFQDIIDSIRAMDADVISIETSRSHGELISSFEEHTYPLGIGLGVYDIHSPRVPQVQEMTSMIDRALQVLDPELFWINPDCGLKTRRKEETVDALRNMVESARLYREKQPVRQ